MLASVYKLSNLLHNQITKQQDGVEVPNVVKKTQ